MERKNKLSNKTYIEISEIINNKILEKLKETRLTVFLIGAGEKNRDSIREKIRSELISKKYRTWFDVYYPENIFEALMKGKIGFNLLDLENILADSVNTIVIILESPGSIAEFGAFAVHSRLKDKLLVVVEKKYRRSKSFINQGLIKYIIKKTNSRVIYHSYKDDNLLNLSKLIKREIREVSKETTINEKITNPIIAQYFLLAAIFLTEPVKKDDLRLMVNSIIKKIPKEKKSIEDEVVILSALSILYSNKDIEFKGNKYCLTQNGLSRFKGLINKVSEKSELKDLLDNLRVKIMNKTLRK